MPKITKPWEKGFVAPDPSRRASWLDDLKRFWFLASDGTIIRFLNWSDYSRCARGGEPREFYLRIPSNDPRPRGIELVRANHPRCPATAYDRQYYTNLYSQLVVGTWTEFVAPKSPQQPRIIIKSKIDNPKSKIP